MTSESEENVAPVPGHEESYISLATPRRYTARGGWNINCECGASLGDTGYPEEEQDALWREHLAEVEGQTGHIGQNMIE